MGGGPYEVGPSASQSVGESRVGSMGLYILLYTTIYYYILLYTMYEHSTTYTTTYYYILCSANYNGRSLDKCLAVYGKCLSARHVA